MTIRPSLGYYPLPSDNIKSLGAVIENHERSPCLFIDGVDLLAKHNHEAFIKLVQIAKSLALVYLNESIF